LVKNEQLRRENVPQRARAETGRNSDISGRPSARKCRHWELVAPTGRAFESLKVNRNDATNKKVAVKPALAAPIHLM
jgi:hypothetical protein